MANEIANKQLIYNLRFRWKETLAPYSDATLLKAYADFAMSDMYGNNDERFLEWLDCDDYVKSE